MSTSLMNRLLSAGLVLGLSASAAAAGPLMDRIAAGEPIRLGFANELPFAYPGDDGKPMGFVNAYVLGVLAKMGDTNIEPVVTEWGGLIPGLQAGRFDIITGGMNILKARCENIAFSEPMAMVGDAFIVVAGNPKGIQNYDDIKAKGAVMATGAGYNTVTAAKEAGIPDANIMQVPGPTEILAAVKAGRADAGAMTFFAAGELANSSDGAIEVTDPAMMPESAQNWVGIGFKTEDKDFLEAFNAAQKDYLGSDEMLAAVASYGYTKDVLPGDKTTEWVCANR